MPESYVQGMVQGIQNWNRPLIYKAFAVLVSILHEKCKGSKTPYPRAISVLYLNTLFIDLRHRYSRFPQILFNDRVTKEKNNRCRGLHSGT